MIRENHQADVVDENVMVIRDKDAISHVCQSNCEPRLKGGIPKGSTDAEKIKKRDALTAAKNEVTSDYHNAREEREVINLLVMELLMKSSKT